MLPNPFVRQRGLGYFWIHRSGLGGLGFRVFKVHMEKKVENEIETGMIWCEGQSGISTRFQGGNIDRTIAVFIEIAQGRDSSLNFIVATVEGSPSLPLPPEH